MAAVEFAWLDWAAAYPSLACSVDQALATSYFNRASLILDPTDSSPVSDPVRRAALLYLLVAHYAFIGGAGGGTAGLVGRISKATEGSVTVEADYGTPSQGAAWFLQSPYGAEYWQATASLRSFRYRPGPRPSFEPYLNAWGRVWR